MINEKLQKDLNKLREYFSDSDEESKGQIRAWEDRIYKLQSLSGYCELDSSKEILAHCENQVKKINKLLFLDETMTDDVRKVFYGKRTVWMYLIKLFSKDHKSEIQQIEDAVKFQVEGIENVTE